MSQARYDRGGGGDRRRRKDNTTASGASGSGIAPTTTTTTTSGPVNNAAGMGGAGVMGAGGGNGGGGMMKQRRDRGDRGDRGERDRERRDRGDRGDREDRDRDRDKKLDTPQKSMMLSTPVILGAKPAHTKPPSTPEAQKEVTGASKGVEVIKMISEGFEFQMEAVSRYFQSDLDDFTVVGVIGSQGVGKSSILNQLAGLHDGEPLFTPQTYENQCQSEHQTGGVDVSILSAERLILLDSQPVLSPSILLNSTKLTELSGEASSHENLLHVQSLQLLVYMLSVCHIVIVVQEALPDLSLWRLFKSACMLKFNIPDVSYLPTENEQMFEYTADPVVVFNKLIDSEYLDFDESSAVLPLALDKFFVTPKNGKIGSEGDITEETQKSNSVPFFLIPLSDDECNIMPSFQQASDKLRRQILSFPKKSFSKPISEKEWAKNASRIWEMVRKSVAIQDYNKTLQKMQMFKS